MERFKPDTRPDSVQTALRLLSVGGMLLCAGLALWAWRQGLLTSPEAMAAFVARSGKTGAALFMAFQAVQVVLPILPGGLGCLVGVVLFGGIRGFLYNYIGICAGSLLAFTIARSCGLPLLRRLFSPALLERYGAWTDRHFTRCFAVAIFLPVAPDDFLCYLAGTTRMDWRSFTAIILLGKPFAIALYSLGLSALWQGLQTCFI